MQPTHKYYEADAYRTEAAGRILAAEPDGNGGGKIALDGTVFYPEGGGQPADRGTLTLPDGTTLNVTDVHEHDGILWHSVDALPGSAVPGTAVSGCIDWEWRFDKMQQHTGEHILSGILHQMFGAENVGFHIGTDAVRMDTSVPISAEGLREAELAANRIVWQNVPVCITYPTREELAALTYRSKKEIEGQVRIVSIPGADVCACCGTHTAATGAVGQIKILAAENYKGGVRLSIVCGERALLAAQAMRQRQAEIGALLSAKPSETAHAVHRVFDEYTALKFAHFGLCSELFDALAAQVAPGADAIGFAVYLDELDRLSAPLPPVQQQKTDRVMLNVALPKGRLGDKVYGLLARIGCAEDYNATRKLVVENPEAGIRYFLVKPSDVAIYVEHGAADVGIVGKDILTEASADVYELLDTGLGRCRMCVAAPNDYQDDPSRPVRVATKFVNIAKNYYASIGRDIDIIKLNGSIELAPILGLSDVIVDIVETGTTLRENGLKVVTEFLPISARFIANKASYQFKHREVDRMLEQLRETLQEAAK